MEAEEKVVAYELQIRDMLQTLSERLAEFEGKQLDDIELGRKLAYTEMMEIIKTRHSMIMDVLADDDAEDASLLALAEERMKGYDPSKVVTQAEIDAEFGFKNK